MSAKRRASKPLMEKRRRDRINQSLAELKELVTTSDNQSNCRRNRLEKADILELTVQHVHRLHNAGSQSSQTSNDSKESDELFVDGFVKCVKEIKKYLSHHRTEVEDNLLRHLDKCVGQMKGAAGQQEEEEEVPIEVAFVWRPW